MATSPLTWQLWCGPNPNILRSSANKTLPLYTLLPSQPFFLLMWGHACACVCGGDDNNIPLALISKKWVQAMMRIIYTRQYKTCVWLTGLQAQHTPVHYSSNPQQCCLHMLKWRHTPGCSYNMYKHHAHNVAGSTHAARSHCFSNKRHRASLHSM